MTIEIDFESLTSSHANGGHRIEIGQGFWYGWRKLNWIQRLGETTLEFTSINDIQDLSVSIEEIDDALIFHEPNGLKKLVVFQLACDGGDLFCPAYSSDSWNNYQAQYLVSLNDFKIRGRGAGTKRSGSEVALGFNYKLFLDASQIKDYTGTKTQIECTVVFNCKFNPEQFSRVEYSDYRFKLKLVLRPAKPTGQLQMELDKPVFNKGVYYRTAGTTRVGLLHVKNNSSIQFSTPLQANIAIADKPKPDNGSLVFGAVEPHEGPVSNQVHKTALPNVIEVKGLLRGQRVSIPVLCNFDEIPMVVGDTLIKSIEATNQSRDLSISPDSVAFRILPSRIHDEVSTGFKMDEAFEGGANYALPNHSRLGVLTLSTHGTNSLPFPLDFSIDLQLIPTSRIPSVGQQVYFQEYDAEIVHLETPRRQISRTFTGFTPGSTVDIPIAFCKGDIQPKPEKQTFEVVVLLHGGGIEKEVVRKPFFIRPFVVLEEFESKFILSEDFQNGYSYKPAENVWLGDFKIRRKSNAAYNQPLSSTIKFDLDHVIPNGIEVRHKDVEGDISYEVLDKQTVQVQTWGLQDELTIPVYVHLNNFPEDDSKEQVYFVKVGVECFNLPAVEVKRLAFVIRPHQYPTQIKIVVSDAEKKVFVPDWITQASPIDLPDSVIWIPQRIKSRTPIFSLLLCNRAKHGKGVVNVEFTDIIPALKGKDTDLASLDFISVSFNDDTKTCALSDLMSHPKATLRDGDEPQTINFLLEPTNTLFDLDDYKADVGLTLTFNYEAKNDADQETAPEERHRISRSISFTIERSLGDHWLALDLGTSAIVAAFDDGNSTDVQLFDLQDTLKNYYIQPDLGKPTGEKADKPKGGAVSYAEYSEPAGHKFNETDYTKESIREFGTPFLDSNVILRSRGEIDTSSWTEDIVHLSASVGEQNRSLYTVPYIKSLVGAEFVNNYNRAFDNFDYMLNGDLVKSSGRNKIKVETILKNTYRIIFRDFIKKRMEDEQQTKRLNKIIATYPNTFSPKHLDLIRKIIKSEVNIPNPESNLVFLSESDAVAQYYLANRKKYNENRPKDKQFDTTPDGKILEYLLVYDMGAGTLDLTLMKLELDVAGGGAIRGHVEIMGRLGKNTAGNYFDNILAKALFGLIGGKNTDLDAIRDRGERFDIKNFVRDELKPKLNSPASETIILSERIKTLADAKKEITYGELLEHSLVKSYFEENTAEVFDNFFRLVKPDLIGKIVKFPIHTVLISGRASQMTALRDKIESAIDGLSTADGGAFIVNADAVLSTVAKPEEKNKKLKSVVVQGAIRHATKMIRQENPSIKLKNKNILASYGFLYGDGGEDNVPWQYVEVLSPHTPPQHPDPADIKDGLWIYTYDIKRILNLEDAKEVKFVQSFTTNTAEMYSNKKREYITEIISVDISNLKNQHSVPVRVRVTLKNEMLIEIGMSTFMPDSPLAVDLFNNETFKNSMWPHYDPS